MYIKNNSLPILQFNMSMLINNNIYNYQNNICINTN